MCMYQKRMCKFYLYLAALEHLNFIVSGSYIKQFWPHLIYNCIARKTPDGLAGSQCYSIVSQTSSYYFSFLFSKDFGAENLCNFFQSKFIKGVKNLKKNFIVVIKYHLGNLSVPHQSQKSRLDAQISFNESYQRFL